MAVVDPIRVGVLFGGRSAEHEVSLDSARAVLDHLDPSRYEVSLVGITQRGGWLGQEDSARLLAGENPRAAGGTPYLPPGVDCVFPVLHGPYGEDGTVQGWLELMDVPFVGSGCTGSAVAMDKAVCKRILRDASIPILSWTDIESDDFEANGERVVAQIVAERGLPCFIKPARMGSSVGITKATNEDEVQAGLEKAFLYDRYAIAEPAFEARELEVSILEGRPPIVSVPGEVKPQDWYDYEAKYENDSAELFVPAEGLQPRMIAHVQELALRAFRVLRCSGMARIDFFLGTKNGRPAMNEVNTIPGFTAISMYSKLLEHSGVPMDKLCDRLVQLAIQNHRPPAMRAQPPRSMATV